MSSGLLPLKSNISKKQLRLSSQPDLEVFPGRCRHDRCLSDDGVLTRRRQGHQFFLPQPRHGIRVHRPRHRAGQDRGDPCMLRLSDVFPFPLVPPGSPLAIASFSEQRSGTGSGVSHSSRKGWPRRRLSSVPSAAAGTLMVLSKCFDLAPDGPKFSTPVGPSRPRSNSAPWLEPTSRPGAPSIAWSVHHCRTMTGVSPASLFPPRDRSAYRMHSKPVRHGQAFQTHLARLRRERP